MILRIPLYLYTLYPYTSIPYTLIPLYLYTLVPLSSFLPDHLNKRRKNRNKDNSKNYVREILFNDRQSAKEIADKKKAAHPCYPSGNIISSES